jgi:hypothetical protein
MTVQDDLAQVQNDAIELNNIMTGGTNLTAGGPIVSTSAADWQSIQNAISVLNSNAQFVNSNDYATLVSSITAIKAKWDSAMSGVTQMPIDVTQLKASIAAAQPTPALPPARSTTTPGVVVVPGTNTTTVVPGAGFTGGQTAAVGLVGAALGLGAGYLMWKSPHRISNPRRRRHRKVSEAGQ